MSLQVNYRYRQLKPDKNKRKQEGVEVRRRFPAKIPLVVGIANRSELAELERDKFLFPATARVHDLIEFINGKIGRGENSPLYVYVKNEIIVSAESTMAELYQEYREDDFFLYLGYFEENIHRHLPVDTPSGALT